MSNNAQHERTKKILKIVGLSLVIIGLVLTIIGMVDFFKSLEKEMPKLFFLTFIGIPILAIGAMFTLLGFRREMTNYIKNESVPIINDTAKDIAPAISSITNTVKENLEGDKIKCKCGELNDKDSKFCKSCGKSLEKTCSKCGAKLEPDSKFCNNCGEKVEE